MAQSLTILGATGSIGKSTLSVVSENPDAYKVIALTARTNVAALFEQCKEYCPRYAVMEDIGSAESLRQLVKEHGLQTEVLAGADALCQVASDIEVDMVMAAIVGAAGLLPTLAAVEAGKKVLLANKEALVMSGALFTDRVAQCGSVLLPVDSEHNAIFQCLPQQSPVNMADSGVEKILLTGSGGPFRLRALASFFDITPDEACAHPNWSMGRKISVDSATMMNKGLEFIEACWLFNAGVGDIEIVIHPQSIIHSMVRYKDGSVLAQMGRPDMRTPIAHCMAWPRRIDAGVEPLDFTKLSSLEFMAPDFERFPCLKLAMNVAEAGKDYAVALNAVNEVSVEAFLQREIKFTDIARINQSVIENWEASEPDAIGAVIDADQRARVKARELVL